MLITHKYPIKSAHYDAPFFVNNFDTLLRQKPQIVNNLHAKTPKPLFSSKLRKNDDKS